MCHSRDRFGQAESLHQPHRGMGLTRGPRARHRSVRKQLVAIRGPGGEPVAKPALFRYRTPEGGATMHKNTKRIAAVGLPLAVVAATGIAFAAWTSNGSGVGSATSATPQDVTFTAATVANSLYPTGSADIA